MADQTSIMVEIGAVWTSQRELLRHVEHLEGQIDSLARSLERDRAERARRTRIWAAGVTALGTVVVALVQSGVAASTAQARDQSEIVVRQWAERRAEDIADRAAARARASQRQDSIDELRRLLADERRQEPMHVPD